jgi:hypothetical protein
MINLGHQHPPSIKSRLQLHAQGNKLAWLISTFAFEV